MSKKLNAELQDGHTAVLKAAFETYITGLKRNSANKTAIPGMADVYAHQIKLAEETKRILGL